MTEEMKIIKRALKHGFNLSKIPNYSPDSFKVGLYEYLIEKKYSVCLEDDFLFVGFSLFDDVVEVTIIDATMKVKPLAEKGFFEIFIELFKYIVLCCELPIEDEDDLTTEEDNNNNDDDEDWWL